MTSSTDTNSSRSLNGALALLKELRDTTPITAQRKRIDTFLFMGGATDSSSDGYKVNSENGHNEPTPPARCEISVVDMNAATESWDKTKPSCYELEWPRFLKMLDAYEAAKSTKPVLGSPVSLAKCKWEISKVFVPDGIWNIEEGMKMERAAKAVLDAAGVKYVD